MNLLPRILLLANRYITPHGVRAATRRASMHLVLECARSREEFLECLHGRPLNLILAPDHGLAGLSLAEILEQARNLDGGIPVVVLGQDESEETALAVLRAGATDFLRATQVARLPFVLERALREQEAGKTAARLRYEVGRAADAMRENQKLVTIGRLSASIAHEINNPLESITNLLYLMAQDEGLPEDSHRYLKMAQGELARVIQITKQTLNFYRETPVPVRVTASVLLEEVLVLYGRRLAEKNIRVERQYDHDDPILVFPGEMRQVFSNLISNAIEAIAGGGRLTLRLRRGRLWGADDGVVGLRVSIADTGAGIGAGVRRRLGEPFFTTKGQKGTGLGLWVTQSIVRRYGGQLNLRSSTDPLRHGTVFSVFLPANLGPRAVPPAHTMAEASARATGRQMEAMEEAGADGGTPRISGTHSS